MVFDSNMLCHIIMLVVKLRQNFECSKDGANFHVQFVKARRMKMGNTKRELYHYNSDFAHNFNSEFAHN